MVNWHPVEWKDVMINVLCLENILVPIAATIKFQFWLSIIITPLRFQNLKHFRSIFFWFLIFLKV